jgi:hypothetical protein
VGGVVTAEAGRLGTPSLIAIQDSTGGIVVRLDDTIDRPSRGTWLEITGTLADPYGQLEIRNATDARVVGPAPLPTPIAVDGESLGEAVEACLVSVEGVAEGRPVKSTSGDVTFFVTTDRGTIRIAADASAGLSTSSVAKGDRLRISGVAGQRASHKDAPDGYRIWVRGAADVVRVGGSASSGPSPSPSPTSATDTAPVRSIAAAILAANGGVAIEGTVTAPASLLDATNRRVIVQDRSAAIEVLMPSGATAPRVGTRVRVRGEVGRAYGAPRIKAETVQVLGSGSITALELRAAPGAAHEWRLVRVRGDVVEIHRSGDRWTAELLVGGTRVPIAGLAGAGIPSAALVAGRTATIVGIVRRAWPTATDRRFAVVPRSPGDLTLGGSADPSAAGSSGSGSSGAAGSSGPGGTGAPGAAVADLDLVDLRAHVGETARVSGLVASVEATAFRLDDGTATARVRLDGPAADLAGSLVAGDALSATGRVTREADGGEIVVVVDDPAAVILVGDLGAQGGDGSGSTGQPGDSASGSVSASPRAGAGSLTAGVGDRPMPEVGAVGLVLISLASLLVTVIRRQRIRRRFAARIAARLAAIGPAAAPSVATSPTAAGPRGP